ncbi:MAG: class I SAM-dependent methyltransferase [Ferruginibacter sp.]|nr:class I SAM-dependent methyltransferase [Ferruginibacter sp.]
MGSQKMQSHLWGQRPEDWASYQEDTVKPGYEYAISKLNPGPSLKFLDIGCGTGYFADMVSQTGADVTGFDGTEPFINEAKKRRNRKIKFLVGEMEELPFANETFDLVSGCNSFQYAADVKHAISEAKRVLKPGGKLAVIIWGEKEDCEASTYLKTIGSLLPPPPPGAPGPFALTEGHLLEKILEELNLKILHSKDVDCEWNYPNLEIAMKGLLSAGPAAKAIEHSGFEKSLQVLKEAVKPYIHGNGKVIYKNKFRVVIAEK